MKQKLYRYLPVIVIAVIIAVFIFNVVTHGYIQHPGKTSYQSQCAQCHGDEGEGIRSLVPPLANSDFALNNFDSIPCWLKFGINHPIVVNGKEYDQAMYPVAMDEVETANVINYIAKEFLNSEKQVSSAKVIESWEKCR